MISRQPGKRALLFILVTVLIDTMGMGVIIPVIPELIMELTGEGLSLLNVTYGFFVLPETLDPKRRRPFEWRRANPVGTLMQIRQHPMVLGLLGSLFLWQVAHQAMPSIWSFYTMFKFGWSEAMVGGSLVFVGAIMVMGQSTLPRIVIPRLGERRTALIGFVAGGVGYLGYAFATEGWMIFAWLLTWLLGALVMPSIQSLMTHRIPADSQGELQGAVGSLYGLSSFIAPPVMTQLFRRFTAADAPVHFPGAAFVLAATLVGGSMALLWKATRHPLESPGTP